MAAYDSYGDQSVISIIKVQCYVKTDCEKRSLVVKLFEGERIRNQRTKSPERVVFVKVYEVRGSIYNEKYRFRMPFSSFVISFLNVM